jgi:hypothetical protein
MATFGSVQSSRTYAGGQLNGNHLTLEIELCMITCAEVQFCKTGWLSWKAGTT